MELNVPLIVAYEVNALNVLHRLYGGESYAGNHAESRTRRKITMGFYV